MNWRGNKYRAKRTEVNGHVFASKREAARYQDLLLLERAGEISGLELQPKYDLIVNGIKVGRFTGDFRYLEKNELVVEDSKGYKVRDYPIRKKLMLACYGIKIRET